MVTPTISPQGSGSADVSYVSGPDSNGVTYYRLNATANDGYVFDRWERTVYWYVRDDLSGVVEGPETRHFTLTGNPQTIWNQDYQSDTARFDVHEISIVAVFRKEEPSPATKFTVTTGMTPNAARGSTSGDGEYEEGTECTVSCAAKCSLWIFDRWEFSTGETYNTQFVTFTVTADVTCTAVFRHANTGQLIYDADGSGSLICAADGSLLYDGDSVDP